MNLEKIKEKIKEKGLKQKYIAEQLGISSYTLQLKLRGDLDFWVREVNKLCDILDIKDWEEVKFFLDKK